MRIKLTNIGMLESADVKLDGLTVIAGENDTGKSTVGKMLFGLLRLPHKTLEIKIDNEKINRIPDINSLVKIFGTTDLQTVKADNFEAVLEINGNVYSCFSCDDGASESSCKLNVELEDEAQKIITDVFFINTPYHLDMAKYIKNTTLLMVQNNLSFHLPTYITDLILRLSQDVFSENKNKKNIDSVIKDTINGVVFYDKSQDDFYFGKNGIENKINMRSVSSGIKMFGYLQILLRNESLKEGSVLILDEPEVHLHPKWQLEYAKIIVELVKLGVIVLVNSHSPYMIEALKVYSDSEKIADKTNFYLAEKSDNGLRSTTREVTNDLEPIFKKLSDPFDTIEKTQIDSVEW